MSGSGIRVPERCAPRRPEVLAQVLARGLRAARSRGSYDIGDRGVRRDVMRCWR
jgi:hypothetical protein